MPVHKFTLTLVSPAFTYGAYQRGDGRDDMQPELRAQSVRGQLRYWLRAVAGAQSDSLSKVWDRESAVFGSTGKGSAVSVRVYAPQGIATAEEPMLPHRKHNGGNVARQLAIKANQKFLLELATRPGVPLPEDALKALKVWSLLGGIGKRSRRMFGAVHITSKEHPLYAWPGDAGSLQALIAATLKEVIGSPASLSRIPQWPTLHPQHSWVIVGGESYAQYNDANRALFNILRGKFRPSTNFGSASPRRASPLHAQIRFINGEYYPVLTAIRSEPTGRIEWKAVADFMRTAERDFSGKTVWGGW